jgi:hypothetical protein
MPPDQIDLSGFLKGSRGAQVSVKPEEHPDEMAARLRSEQRSALIEDCKGIAVFIVLLIGVAGIGVLSAYEGFFDATVSVDTRRWSQTVLSALMAGGVSFVVGRKVGK